MNEDDYIIDMSSMSDSTITLTSSVNDIWINTSTNDWATIDGDTINLDNITIYQPIEFEDEMPAVAKVEDMCKNYPALEKAYENFKTIYKMVHQDWQGKQDSENGSLF